MKRIILGGVVRCVAAVAALVASKMSTSYADTITASDFSGSETVIDFGTWPELYTVPSPYIYTDSGVDFYVAEHQYSNALHLADRPDYFDNVPGASLDGVLLATLVTPPINIDFGDTIANRVGMLVSARDPISTFRLTAFDADGRS